MITIDGDSMEPLLGSGDRILIDTSQRVPAPPGIFVIWDGPGLVAQRTCGGCTRARTWDPLIKSQLTGLVTTTFL